MTSDNSFQKKISSLISRFGLYFLATLFLLLIIIIIRNVIYSNQNIDNIYSINLEHRIPIPTKTNSQIDITYEDYSKSGLVLIEKLNAPKGIQVEIYDYSGSQVFSGKCVDVDPDVDKFKITPDGKRIVYIKEGSLVVQSLNAPSLKSSSNSKLSYDEKVQDIALTNDLVVVLTKGGKLSSFSIDYIENSKTEIFTDRIYDETSKLYLFQNNLYLINFTNNSIQKFTANGNFITDDRKKISLDKNIKTNSFQLLSSEDGSLVYWINESKLYYWDTKIIDETEIYSPKYFDIPIKIASNDSLNKIQLLDYKSDSSNFNFLAIGDNRIIQFTKFNYYTVSINSVASNSNKLDFDTPFNLIRIQDIKSQNPTIFLSTKNSYFSGTLRVESVTFFQKYYTVVGFATILGIFTILYFSYFNSSNFLFNSSRNGLNSTKAESNISLEIEKIPDPPEELTNALIDENCVLFAGAGLSARSGIEVWQDFVNALCDWAKDEQLISLDEFNSYKNEALNRDSNSVIDSIVSKAREQEKLDSLNKYLKKIFLRNTKLSSTHKILRDIDFSAVLTTNFDELLEKTFINNESKTYTYKDTKLLIEKLLRREFFILKLYGSLTEQSSDKILVAPIQFEEELQENRNFSKFMETIFNSKTIFFVGASLEGIDGFLSALSLPREVRKQHFALVAVKKEGWFAKADLMKRRYGITVLPFTTTKNYAEIDNFLENLSEKAGLKKRVTNNKTGENPYLKKIVLKNIGPFEKLEIDLENNWNIILGDNGVGKSSILKAIAVALCGVKAEPFVRKLIKSGNTSASIDIQTSIGTNYLTEIILNNDSGECEIRTNTLMLLETEGWLALGFPPLRPIGLNNTRRPDADLLENTLPKSDDLLPIIISDPDYRLDKLKQWIINLDYRQTKLKNSDNIKSSRYDAQIKTMFEIINKMTYPVEINYLGVDEHTYEIIVETDKDGKIPIESVSQGMTSLIGWVGTLIQRMYEVYENDETPLDRFAIVLIDEIDVHMHPLWQRTLLNRLRDFFPKIQFIVTTHSPLIVAGLPSEQIIRLRRNVNKKITQISVTEEMTAGRADQILTNDLFGLENTISIETENLLEKYTYLSTKDELSDVEKNDLKILSEKLSRKILTSQQRKEAREAFELIQEFYINKLMNKPDEEREKIIREIKNQLMEMVSDTRSPE